MKDHEYRRVEWITCVLNNRFNRSLLDARAKTAAALGNFLVSIKKLQIL